MTRYRGYLIDLDGTLYKGERVVPSGLGFVESLEERGLSYLYFTNNSLRRPEQVAEKLRGFGYPAKPEQVVTSAQATAAFLTETLGSPSVYAIGGEGLKAALSEAGCRLTDQSPQAVVMGLDPAFTYDKMKTACLAIRAGADFYGTNGDLMLPTDEGLLPGSGSLCAGVAAATGVQPRFIGKPERPIVEYGMRRLGTTPEETLIVGDNMMTDIRAGVDNGIDTLLVFGGVTSPEEYRNGTVRATYTVGDLKEWEFI
ncbi:MAG: TIGR01457 family HAD-type hydrolase [Firmicutes bacterium]|uniref:4-nitrophenyl phosphatase n=1 Tax=Melghirimyces thermohalophilus TaxID=1236220 RepID=A0A1G6L3A3_9BACL|nr:TIGR01457 family HAD-type hydrolase [Melghirimyces thermohalophilus]MDA8352096.1 TIGR01457 family HAD-type hydrolase [Bacillota bacterium]SDC37790.1 4-nitrophenyl phosphatase [Melghirimyces thermohalophilus]